MSALRSSSLGLVLAVGLVVPAFAQSPARRPAPATPTPTPAPVAPTPAPAPGAPAPTSVVDAPDPNDPVDHLAILTGIARKKGRRVMRELRVLEADLPTVVAAVRRTEPDGTEDLYVTYDVSLFNQCVFREPTHGRAAMRARREECAAERGIETNLVHVRIAPTPRGRAEDAGGELTFVGEALALGRHGASYAQMANQTFFDGMGPIDAGSASDLRIWVAVTEVEFEESNDSRGPHDRNEWYGKGAQHFRVYDTTLGVETDETLVSGELETAAGAPTVSFDGHSHVLDVRSGTVRVRLRYVAESDTFAPAT